MTTLDLEAIRERAASAAFYTDSSYGKQVMGVDVPDLVREVERLREAIAEIRAAALAHHGDEDAAVLLHALLVEIPFRCEAFVSPSPNPSEVERLRGALEVVAAGIWRNPELNAAGVVGGSVMVHAVEDALSSAPSRDGSPK